MATVINSKAPPTKPKKDREREKERKEKAPQISERLKTVVRRLPPNLPEDVFWQSVQPWVSDETVTWKKFYPGKSRKRLNKENISSRAYIAFKNEEQLALFSQEYDGHLFRDKAGNESQAVVEFAPYQKVPTEKKKPDARNATIEKDEDYISFLESLTAAANVEPVTLEALIAATQPPPPPKTTPLLEALKAEKSAHKDKEAILRNHAHYKDQTHTGPSGARKDDVKKKGMPGPKPVEPSAGSKKAIKKATPTPAAVSTQKPPPATGSGSGVPAKNTPGPPNPTSQSPKAPRAARQAQQGKPPITPIATAVGPAVSIASSGGLPSSSGTPTLATPGVPSTAPRRTRPVIGLASRQFEAALSGAGVGNGTGERKSRREREKEKEKEKEGSGAVASTVEKAKDTPTTPKKDRRRKDVGHDGGAVGEPFMKVPSILQRGDGPPAILQRETQGLTHSVEAGSAAVISPVTQDGHGVPGAGRGARRGRGRGRGVNPGAPRGG